MESLYVVMPAYNEEANIQKVIGQWYPVLEGKSENSKMLLLMAEVMTKLTQYSRN